MKWVVVGAAVLAACAGVGYAGAAVYDKDEQAAAVRQERDAKLLVTGHLARAIKQNQSCGLALTRANGLTRQAISVGNDAVTTARRWERRYRRLLNRQGASVAGVRR